MKCKYCGQEYKKAEMYHIKHGLNIHFISEDTIEYLCGDCYYELMVYISKFKKPRQKQDDGILVNITDELIDEEYTMMCLEDELHSIKERYGLSDKSMKRLVGELND